MDNINNLNEAWIASGQRVNNLNSKIKDILVKNNFDKNSFKNLKEELDTEKMRRDALRSQLSQARNNKKPMKIMNAAGDSTPDSGSTSSSSSTPSKKFGDDVKGLINNDPNVVTSSTDEKGNAIGLTVPSDVETKINELVRQYDSLQQYVNVESVSTSNGSRVYESMTDITPLHNLDSETDEIPANDNPSLTKVSFTIARFAGITTITNSLLNDSSENLMAWLSSWIAKKSVVTRNQAILNEIGKQPKKPGITKFDDVKDIILTSVDPAIANTSKIFTNVSGFAQLAKVKYGNGQYLMQPSVDNHDVKEIDGKQVVVIADRWLPDENGSHPFIYGDLKQGITLFDRQQMSLLTSNTAAGAYEHDETKLRVIDRFATASTDKDSYVVDSFKDIADQKVSK